MSVKQGGIATQQADAVAKSIAALAGAPVTPEPLRPVLRGLLLTGNTPGYHPQREQQLEGGNAAAGDQYASGAPAHRAARTRQRPARPRGWKDSCSS
jgi:hypothetical protein